MSDLSLIDIVNLIRAEIARTEIGDVKKITGPAGEQGPQGEAGIQGPQGPRGNDGKPGPIGPKGNQGKKGDKGVKGDDGADGVGIARIEQDIDNNIVIYTTDGEFYTVEMPLIQDDGSLAKEVHFKVGGGGGSGSVDLSGYVRRPAPEKRTGQWLAYKEDPGGTNRQWEILTTDMVETNPGITFNANGRFNPSQDVLDDLTTQLKVNRFLWEHIQQLDLDKSGIEIGPNAPVPLPGEDLADGTFWFDNTEEVMQLFIWHEASDAWIPVAPPVTLESRVRAGELTQEAIIDQIQRSLVDQELIREQLRQATTITEEHAFKFTVFNVNPRGGEFNLQDGSRQITADPDKAVYLAVSNYDYSNQQWNNDKPNEGDTIRIDNGDQYLLFNIVDGTNGFFAVEKVGGDITELQTSPVYDFTFFIDIDPNEIAYKDYVDAQDEANRQYVDDQIAGIDVPEPVAFERPMLWKYNPGVSANNLGNGEFNLSSGPTNGGASEWSIYFAKRDASGQYWYPHDNGNAYTHSIGEQLATIRGREQVCAHGKTKQWLFNQGTNKYAQLKLTYYRSSNPLGTGKYHLITIPGYMPYFTFSADAQTNGTH